MLNSVTHPDEPVECHPAVHTPRRFEFEHDSFAFANELHWAYHYDAATGKTTFARRAPPPNYAHRCFVLARTARQFYYHARFDLAQPTATEAVYRRLIREVVARNPRTPCSPGQCIVFPGFASLREFSTQWERLLKSECGGAWRSYMLRSHWRMVFPISRMHQAQTAERLEKAIQGRDVPIVHLIRFPRLSINHGMVLFSASPTGVGCSFAAYDPNDSVRPTVLSYEANTRTFTLPPNHYWVGGWLDVIEIYRGWFM